MGIDRERLIEACERFVETAELTQDGAVIIMEHLRACVDVDRLAHRALRILDLTELRGRDGIEVQRCKVPRMGGEKSPVKARRFRDLSSLVQRLGATEGIGGQ